jgi:hypothetical protein
VTEQNPGNGIYDSPELFKEAPGCQEYSLDEYLKQFEDDERPGCAVGP